MPNYRRRYKRYKKFYKKRYASRGKYVKKSYGNVYRLAKKVTKIIRGDAEHKYNMNPAANTAPINQVNIATASSNMTNNAGAGLIPLLMTVSQGTGVYNRIGNKIHMLSAMTKWEGWFTTPDNWPIPTAGRIDGFAVYIHECYATKGNGPGENGSTLKGNIGEFLYPGNVFNANAFQVLTFKKPLFDTNLANFWIRKTTMIKPPQVADMSDNVTRLMVMSKGVTQRTFKMRNKKLIFENNGATIPSNIVPYILIVNDTPLTFHFQYTQFMSFTDE